MIDSMEIFVTDHAMWQAAIRFPHFDTVEIENEVRAAIRAGRVTPDRTSLWLARYSDPASLYVWTPVGRWLRVYALNHDTARFVVATTMRAADKSARVRGAKPPRLPRRRR